MSLFLISRQARQKLDSGAKRKLRGPTIPKVCEPVDRVSCCHRASNSCYAMGIVPLQQDVRFFSPEDYRRTGGYPHLSREVLDRTVLYRGRPSPTPSPTKPRAFRRAWVTSHHETHNNVDTTQRYSDDDADVNGHVTAQNSASVQHHQQQRPSSANR